MNKTVVVFASIFALLLSACLPNLNLTSTPATGPTVDTAGTSAALLQTAVVKTLTAQPVLPVISVTDTATVPVESPVLAVTDTPSATQTSVILPNLTTTPVTATSGPATGGSPTTASGAVNATFTATLAAGQVTASPTNGIMTYGTLPPEVPFVRVKLINKAKAEAYISLQVTMPDGKFSIIEYPVEGTVKIESPVGQYVYVAWIGGRKIVGNFRIYAGDDVEITLYRNKVVVK